METEIQEILEALIDSDLMDFKCFDILKQKLIEEKRFREIVKIGIENGLIRKFPRDLFDKVCEQNIRAPFEPIQLFIDGANLGNCTIMSKIISYSMNNIDICGGTLDILKGTKNSPDGRHTWISFNGNIIDPTLMITIDEKLKTKLGYTEENRYNPAIDKYYLAAKEYANDPSLKKGK
jgi:hypothetical protein